MLGVHQQRVQIAPIQALHQYRKRLQREAQRRHDIGVLQRRAQAYLVLEILQGLEVQPLALDDFHGNLLVVINAAIHGSACPRTQEAPLAHVGELDALAASRDHIHEEGVRREALQGVECAAAWTRDGFVPLVGQPLALVDGEAVRSGRLAHSAHDPDGVRFGRQMVPVLQEVRQEVAHGDEEPRGEGQARNEHAETHGWAEVLVLHELQEEAAKVPPQGIVPLHHYAVPPVYELVLGEERQDPDHDARH
mmetsp:Transcript_15781/g.44749  ORF Transcript_15781/g.44749 Transcript_15781/m.44749 type:complete len:250 (-) Transcript_15781:1088-1837(-)